MGFCLGEWSNPVGGLAKGVVTVDNFWESFCIDGSAVVTTGVWVGRQVTPGHGFKLAVMISSIISLRSWGVGAQITGL